MAKEGGLFRKFRILVLLLMLFFVAVGSWKGHVRLTSWERTVNVAIYPIAADASPATAQFIQALEKNSFTDIDDWVQAETRRYGLALKNPVQLWLGPQVQEIPPAPPQSPNMLTAIFWSLKLRWWAFRHDDFHAQSKMKPQVRLFVLFHDVGHDTALPHSIGLKEGGIGVIHVFAHQEQRRQNFVIIAHELLHTFGATDKYDFATLHPLFPAGYAEPERQPRLPQRLAEIMGGRIPKTAQSAEIPASLQDTRIGPATALEIGLSSAR